MSETTKKMLKYPACNAMKALNPQFFGLSYKETVEPSKPLISKRSDIAPHSLSLTTDEQKLNKTEKSYLLYLRNNGNLWVGIQCISLKMGHDCRYVPDFLVLNGSGFLELHEVKGFMRQHSLVKLNVIARTYRFFKVIVVRRKDGAWSFQEVKP